MTATPLTAEQRAARYRRQTGRSPKRAYRGPAAKWWWVRDDLTPKQRRRVRHKANRHV